MQEIARMGIIYLKGLLVIELLVRYTLRSWKISHYHERHTFKWRPVYPQVRIYHHCARRFFTTQLCWVTQGSLYCVAKWQHIFVVNIYPPNHIFYAHPQSRMAEHIHEQLNRTIVNREKRRNASPVRLLHQTSCWPTQLFQICPISGSFDWQALTGWMIPRLLWHEQRLVNWHILKTRHTLKYVLILKPLKNIFDTTDIISYFRLMNNESRAYTPKR